MPYSTLADVTLAAGGAAKLIQLADYDGDGVVDAGVVDSAIADADGTIDTYLQKRFATPLAAATPAIRRCSARLAVYEMRTQRQMIDKPDEDRHAKDVEWLEAIRDGHNLPGVEPLPLKSSVQIDQVGDRDATLAVSTARLKGFW